MTKRTRLGTVGLVFAVGLSLFSGIAAASSTSEAPQLEYGVGLLTTTGEGATAVRSVEAWVASDGRYRVVTTSLDTTGASEEVTFDGKAQTAVITDPSGKVSLARGDFVEHFAVRREQPKDGARETTVAFVLDANGLAMQHDRAYESGARSELRLEWEAVGFDDSLLAHAASLQPLADIALVDQVPPPANQRASGSNSKTFTGLNGAACVDAYNFRNTTTGYFRGSSRDRGTCYYMAVTLWNGAASGGAGFCSAIDWLGAGPTAANFSSKYVTTRPVGLSPTCSSHAGWLSDWTQYVAWKGLNTNY